MDSLKIQNILLCNKAFKAIVEHPLQIKSDRSTSIQVLNNELNYGLTYIFHDADSTRTVKLTVRYGNVVISLVDSNNRLEKEFTFDNETSYQLMGKIVYCYLCKNKDDYYRGLSDSGYLQWLGIT
ncbi:hypothetical protein FDJ06_gp143 [Pseudomonas phage SL2]|uniref:Uncharacterized protein n=1 Tax=Pseudomonas phage SL2 TaxID=2041345 RepID=A0A2D1GQV0_9CAUD|nr:hypothetical protein FDJ06_gp143 [Pseudomonas phage SL2]ATN94720.1 hypothetical protein SL2_143 [Pseudomonas phage SL2]